MTKSRYPRIIIAGLKGGSGKTTLSLGLIAAWRKKGLNIVPYKKGPDYIDAGWLSSAAGHRCYNLDPFLIGSERIISSFVDHYDGDCAVIEGNRGLYDGVDAEGTYSTAELSRILQAPVILIMDCTKVTRTTGAMLLGMQRFDKRVRIKGVVLNQIAGARHEKIIREVVKKYCRIPVLGAIPKLSGDFLSERHMGLTPFQEHPEVEKAIAHTAEIANKYLDLNGIWEIAKASPGIRDLGSGSGKTNPQSPTTAHRVRIGIIRDSAFQFYYPENFEELTVRGAELVEISALTEKRMPDVDALYIGGGFPETNAIALARNRSFRKSVKDAAERGLPVYAECGGLMYLGTSLLLDGKTYPMAGVFPLRFSLEKRPRAHGYTVVEVTGKNPFYKKGTVLKGHEFHYSNAVDFRDTDGISFSFAMTRGQGIIDKKDGICYKNTMATYTHLHAYGSPEWAEGLIKQAVLHRRKKRRQGA
jgi:cobyrinic acid a,c-diamide synthase